MAIQTGAIQFQGKLGNVIGYYRNGKYCLRSRPQQVRQTAATREAAQAFGMISSKGKLIRRSILPYLSCRYDGAVMNRLNKELVKATRSPQYNPLLQQSSNSKQKRLSPLRNSRFFRL